jgi:hypothetical protein
MLANTITAEKLAAASVAMPIEARADHSILVRDGGRQSHADKQKMQNGLCGYRSEATTTFPRIELNRIPRKRR